LQPYAFHRKDQQGNAVFFEQARSGLVVDTVVLGKPVLREPEASRPPVDPAPTKGCSLTGADALCLSISAESSCLPLPQTIFLTIGLRLAKLRAAVRKTFAFASARK
jgi:hypothetical protein